MPLPNLLPAGAKPRGSDFNALRAQLEAQRITGVAGLIGGAFSGGSALAALGLPPVPRRTIRKDMPFQVNLTDSSTSAPKATISAYSRLYRSIGGSSISITSLTTEFSLASNTFVWLQCTVNSFLEVSAAAIQTGTTWPAFIVTSGSPAVQTQFNVPIGRVTASAPSAPGFEFILSSTQYHFEQLLFSHLLVESRAENGTPAIYAFPWSGA